MIIDIRTGDITDPAHKSDIIIAMNTELGEPSAIGRPFVRDIVPKQLLQLGSVLTFKFDEERLLHMIVCHHLGDGGWRCAEQFVRFGLDYLWQSQGASKYSIVKIGSGRIGQRDGANVGAIIRAMSDSHLCVTLFIREQTILVPNEPQKPAKNTPLTFVRGWNQQSGILVSA